MTYYHIYTSSRKKRTNHSLVFIKIKWPLHVCSKMWKQKKMCVCGFHEIFHPVKSLVSIICSDFINHHRHFYEFSTTNSRIVKKKITKLAPFTSSKERACCTQWAIFYPKTLWKPRNEKCQNSLIIFSHLKKS